MARWGNDTMFTGIITAIGTITALQPRGGDVRLRIATGKLELSDVRLGDSIAVSGVCLTAVELPGDGFWADASRETLERTSLGAAQSGTPVNLEKAPSKRSNGCRPGAGCAGGSASRSTSSGTGALRLIRNRSRVVAVRSPICASNCKTPPGGRWWPMCQSVCFSAADWTAA